MYRCAIKLQLKCAANFQNQGRFALPVSLKPQKKQGNHPLNPGYFISPSATFDFTENKFGLGC
jgi:hypothetical protein